MEMKGRKIMQAERIKLYDEFVDVFMDTLKLTKVHTVKDKVIHALGIRIQSIGLRMAIISSDKVVKCFMVWRATASGGDPVPTVNVFSELVLEMRKELLGETSRTKDDIFDILT
jgi:hypothetical protein